jgi:hypothetical protein
VALIAEFKNYNAALYLTAFIVCCGILLLKYAQTNLVPKTPVENET